MGFQPPTSYMPSALGGSATGSTTPVTGGSPKTNFNDPNYWFALSATLGNMAWAPVKAGINVGQPMAEYEASQQQKADARKQTRANEMTANKTDEFLKVKAPDLYEMTQSGIMDRKAAINEYAKRESEARKPKNLSVFKGDDGSLYQYDPANPKGTFSNIMPGQQKPADLPTGVDEWNWYQQQTPENQAAYRQWKQENQSKNGKRVLDANGNVIYEEGAIGDQPAQKVKNDANRISEIQAQTAVGSELKQTAKLMKDAAANVGYSGPGAGLYGAVADTAEQLTGYPLLGGSASSRATMNSQSLNVVLSNVQKTKGAISNAEMSLFEAAAPGMSKTPQGNAALIEIADKIADRTIERGKQAEQWYRQNQTLDGFEGYWADYIAKNPIIVDAGNGAVQPASAAKAGTTKKGLTFKVIPNGNN